MISRVRIVFCATFGASLGIPVAGATVAFAQTTVPAPTPAAPADPGGAQPGGGARLSPYIPGASGSGPAQPSGPIGGGNVNSSSSRPITGPNDRDGFDLVPKTEGVGVARGGDNGPIFLGGQRYGGDVPTFHSVRRGDTLWGICDYYFRNPYQWPRIWSYNAQIQNPHWIYPGDQVRLRQGGGPAVPTTPRSGSLVDRRRQVPPETVFLRTEGFIEDGSDEDWGEITGSPEDKMLLSASDEVYLHISSNREPRLGQELTIFHPVRKAGGGEVVQVQGTVRINQWNPRERVARGEITEALDVIERGGRVGPVGRRFNVVPPARNEGDLTAHIITSVRPHNFYGQNQVVFIDKGADDGLKPGNRLFIMRRGDAWRRTLSTPNTANRISPYAENLPEMERTPGRDDDKYPDEAVGELRVLATKKKTATCLVMASRGEIERNDVAVMRKGY